MLAVLFIVCAVYSVPMILFIHKGVCGILSIIYHAVWTVVKRGPGLFLEYTHMWDKIQNKINVLIRVFRLLFIKLFRFNIEWLCFFVLR